MTEPANERWLGLIATDQREEKNMSEKWVIKNRGYVTGKEAAAATGRYSKWD